MEKKLPPSIRQMSFSQSKWLFSVFSVLSPIAGFLLLFVLDKYVHIEDSTHFLTPLFLVVELMLYFLITGFVLAIIALVKGEGKLWVLLAFLMNSSHFFLVMIKGCMRQ
jgi:hypothetical protein